MNYHPETHSSIRKSYERQLIIFKNRIKDDQNYVNQRRSGGSMAFFNSSHTLPNAEHLYSQKKQVKTLKQVVSNIRIKAFTRVFIQKLKRNSQKFIRHENFQALNIISSPSVSFIDVKGLSISNYWRALISFFTMLSLIFVVIISFFQIFFQQFRILSSQSKWMIAIKILALCFVIIKFIGGFIVQTIVFGMKIQRIGQITKNYLRSMNFLLDSILLLSLIFLIAHPLQIYPGLFGYCSTFINIIYLQKLEEIIDITFFDNKIKRQYFALFKLILGNFYVAHIIGTFMLTITLVHPDHNWMNKYGIQSQFWFTQYLYSFYWATTITTTVGFGDITVSNSSQVVLATFVMLIGCLSLSYNISKVGSIIAQLTAADEMVHSQLSTLRRIASVSGITEGLHHQMAEYIVHAAEIKKSFQIQQRKNIMLMLPQQMRQEYLYQSSTNFFKTIPFFCFLSIKTKIKIAQKLSLQIAAPGQFLTHKIKGLQKIKIIRKGIVNLTYKKKGSKMNGAIVESISVEGENPHLLNKYLLFRGKRLNYNIISQSYSSVATLDIQQMKQSVRQNKRDFQFYFQLYDSAMISEDQWNEQCCRYCSTNHSVFVCPKLHYMPYRNIVFIKFENNGGKKQNRIYVMDMRFKPVLAKRSSLKIWKRIFKKIEFVFSVKSGKQINSTYIRKDSDQIQKQNKKTNHQIKVSGHKSDKNESFMDVDILCDFQNYFVKCNPKLIAETPLDKFKGPIAFQRFNSAPS